MSLDEPARSTLPAADRDCDPAGGTGVPRVVHDALIADDALRANLLIAFPYFSDECAARLRADASSVRLLVDSGAFTAWKAGKSIALDDYCRFLETLPVDPWRYFTLDVVGDAHGTMRNYETMLRRGFKPVPIFTRGEDPSVLEDYYRHSEVVGVGGLVGTRKNRGFVNGLMKLIGKRKVHWLGFTVFEYLKFYRPYMCDSSNWESGGRFGAIKLYMGAGKYRAVAKAEFMHQPPQEVLDRIAELGFDPYAMRRLSSWHGGESLNRRICAASSLALSLDIQRNLGTLMFNAIADTGRGVKFFLEAWHKRQHTGASA